MPVHDTMEPGERAFYNLMQWALFKSIPCYQWPFCTERKGTPEQTQQLKDQA